MLWWLYSNKEDAEAQEAAITSAMITQALYKDGAGVVGVKADTGSIAVNSVRTERYAIPKQLDNGVHAGKWGFKAPSIVGAFNFDVEIEYDPTWFNSEIL